MIKIWEAQDNEPLSWYHRFMKYYLGQPSGTREIRKAVLNYGEAEGVEILPEKLHSIELAWHRIAKKWNWVKRADAYDSELYRKRMEDEIEESKDMLRRQANIGKEMQTLAQIKLNDEFREIKKTGRPLIDMAEARLLFKEGIAIERQARGLPDYLLAVANLSDDELLTRYERLLGEVTEIERNESLGVGDGEEGDDPTATDQPEALELPGQILE